MYSGLKFLAQEDRQRTVEGLSRRRKPMAAQLPPRPARESLLPATWNIRDFGAVRLNPSPRFAESLHYMAEIIAAFDSGRRATAAVGGTQH